MIALFLLALLPRVEIVAANDSTVTYRELVPLRVALDPATHLFHYAGCPAIQPGMEPVSPAAATLRGYKEHTSVSLRKDEYAIRVEKTAVVSRLRHAERCISRRSVVPNGGDQTDLAVALGLRDHPGTGGRAAMDLMFAEEARKSGATPVLFMTWYPGNADFFRAAAQRAHTLLLPVAGSHRIACSVYSMIYKKPCGEESLK